MTRIEYKDESASYFCRSHEGYVNNSIHSGRLVSLEKELEDFVAPRDELRFETAPPERHQAVSSSSEMETPSCGRACARYSDAA